MLVTKAKKLLRKLEKELRVLNMIIEDNWTLGKIKEDLENFEEERKPNSMSI